MIPARLIPMLLFGKVGSVFAGATDLPADIPNVMHVILPNRPEHVICENLPEHVVPINRPEHALIEG